MTHFRLIGRANTFRVTRFFTMLGGTLQCVEGIDDDKGIMTRARVEDVQEL